MMLHAVVQQKLHDPCNKLIHTLKKHVAISLEVLTDYLIVNQAVATIVKLEVCLCMCSQWQL